VSAPIKGRSLVAGPRDGGPNLPGVRRLVFRRPVA